MDGIISRTGEFLNTVWNLTPVAYGRSAACRIYGKAIANPGKATSLVVLAGILYVTREDTGLDKAMRKLWKACTTGWFASKTPPTQPTVPPSRTPAPAPAPAPAPVPVPVANAARTARDEAVAAARDAADAVRGVGEDVDALRAAADAARVAATAASGAGDRAEAAVNDARVALEVAEADCAAAKRAAFDAGRDATHLEDLLAHATAPAEDEGGRVEEEEETESAEDRAARFDKLRTHAQTPGPSGAALGREPGEHIEVVTTTHADAPRHGSAGRGDGRSSGGAAGAAGAADGAPRPHGKRRPAKQEGQ